jgi:hypothetical protein
MPRPEGTRARPNEGKGRVIGAATMKAAGHDRMTPLPRDEISMDFGEDAPPIPADGVGCTRMALLAMVLEGVDRYS